MLDITSFNKTELFKFFFNLTGQKRPNVLFVSIYNPNYTRTETLLSLFSSMDISVTKAIYPKRYLKVLKDLIKKQKKHDLIIVSFRGHEIMPFIRLFANRPVIFDLFVSVYDTLCLDRKIFTPYGMIGRLLHWYDSLLCKMSSLVLIDTAEHEKFIKKEFNAQNTGYLYLGANNDLFKPLDVNKRKSYTVFWYGTVLPLQGIDVILDAAEYLSQIRKDIQFLIVGPVKKKRNLVNVTYIPWVKYQDLPIEICKSHLCLGGHYSDIGKSKRVVSGKAYQFVACGVPTIVADNPANREVFTDQDVYFVEHNNYKKLSAMIMKVADEKS